MKREESRERENKDQNMMASECLKQSTPQQKSWLNSRFYSSQIGNFCFSFLFWLSFKLEKIHFFKEKFLQK